MTSIYQRILLFNLVILGTLNVFASNESKNPFVGQHLSEVEKNEISFYGVNVDYLSSLYEPNLRIESIEKKPGKFIVVVARLDKNLSGSLGSDGIVVAALDLTSEIFDVHSGPQVECNKSVKDNLVVGIGRGKTINEKKMSFQPKKAWTLDPKKMQFEPLSVKSVICAPKDPNVHEGY